MTVLEINKVSKKIWKAKILNNISFSVKQWEIYGFLWPNGAWKTTVLKCIMWLIQQDSWEIKIFNEKWLTIDSKRKIWFMPENTYLYKYLTWKEFLLFNWHFFGYKKEKLNKKAEKLLKLVWLKEASSKYLNSYSKWMLQRIWLAQSIINDPELLFLDEPMSWLDPVWRKMVKDLLLKLRKTGTTIFFNTHILADVESICDKISIINKWKIIIESKKVSKIEWNLEDFFIEKVS